MKTSVVMIRKMGDFNIHQRTKDGMFNATTLLKQYNKGKRGKEVNGFLKTIPTQEFIKALSESENLNTNEIVLTTRGNSGGTWMHPYLFIDFAMWINSKFKVKVIRFVYDELIKQRHHVGDNYVKLSASGVKLKGYKFTEVAIAMQYIVFGSRGKETRQKATQNQLIELNELQTKMSFAIDMGYITSYQSLIQEFRKIWKRKRDKIPF